MGMRHRIQTQVSQTMWITRLVAASLVLFVTGWTAETKLVVGFAMSAVSVLLLLLLHSLFTPQKTREAISPGTFGLAYGMTAGLGVVEIIMYALEAWRDDVTNQLLVVAVVYVSVSIVLTVALILCVFFLKDDNIGARNGAGLEERMEQGDLPAAPPPPQPTAAARTKRGKAQPQTLPDLQEQRAAARQQQELEAYEQNFTEVQRQLQQYQEEQEAGEGNDQQQNTDQSPKRKPKPKPKGKKKTKT